MNGQLKTVVMKVAQPTKVGMTLLASVRAQDSPICLPCLATFAVEANLIAWTRKTLEVVDDIILEYIIIRSLLCG